MTPETASKIIAFGTILVLLYILLWVILYPLNIRRRLINKLKRFLIVKWFENGEIIRVKDLTFTVHVDCCQHLNTTLSPTTGAFCFNCHNSIPENLHYGNLIRKNTEGIGSLRDQFVKINNEFEDLKERINSLSGDFNMHLKLFHSKKKS